ncbi:carboxylesterase BioH (pimeloyl-CoA synthesis) [Singulisphaera sp. GP187]|uniref:alpha/beta fold hydrolase n=1 Tax=Singulisphaera sp. GP187 TaxID=1882752 RepID=UPI000925DFA2|nr:alpha/beta hydrolase [Singulisphaera sp. GP187]SIO45513.1 carboxylesterase BioH (pimeloyl-CoA synthesis) [Singulisphaera sp. GP187]
MRIAARHRGGWLFSSQIDEARQHQVRINGEWVDVVQMGQGDPLVLVPGLAGGWKLLAPLASQLARHYQVTIPGLRGDRFPMGNSCVSGLSDHAVDLSQLIEQLGLERPSLFGVSFGGAIALELAVEQPHRIGALVVQGVVPKFRTNLGTTIARRVLERFPLPTDNGFLNQFFNLLHGGKPEPGPLTDFVVERCWETDQGVMARRIGHLESFDVSDRLWRIDVPTLVLAGTRDSIVPPSRQRALAAEIAGARYATLEGAGHIAFLSHRVEVAQQVRRFLREVSHTHC